MACVEGSTIIEPGRHPLKILHIITGLEPGGTETVLYRLLSRPEPLLANAVVCLGSGGRLAAEIAGLGVPVHLLGMRRLLRFPDDLRRLRRIVRCYRPDLLQGWMYHGNLAAQLIAWWSERHLPVIWNVRQSLHQFAQEKRSTALLIRLGARLSRWPNTIVYNAHTSARHHQEIGYHCKKTIVIPNGFDSRKFRPRPQARHQLRQELKLAKDIPLIGLIARYHPVKDHHSFFQAASILGRWHPEVHFIAAGSNVDQHNPRLKSLLDQRIRQRVHLLGDRRDIAQITAALDIAVCCSLAEGLANCIGEAMSCGVPCVVTNVGDLALLVSETGLVVPPDCPQALALAWKELLENEVKRRSKGAAARQRIINYYSIERFRENYRKLYSAKK